MHTRFKKLLQLIERNDKVQHFLICYFITSSLLMMFGWVYMAFIVAMLIGVAKEVYDEYFKNGWCWRDMLANFLGSITAIAQLAAGYYIFY